MIRFIGLYVGLIVLLQLANESQCTIYPINPNGKLEFRRSHSHSHSHRHIFGQDQSHNYNYIHNHNIGGDIQGKDLNGGGVGATPVDLAKPMAARPVDVAKPMDATPVDVAKPMDARPVDIAKPMDTTPVDIAKPMAAGPVDVAKPMDATPVDVVKPMDARPVDIAKPMDTTPVDIAPMAVRPVDVAKPMDATPVDVAKPLDARLVDVAKPMDATPVDIAKPMVDTPADVAKPMVATPVDVAKPIALSECIVDQGNAPVEVVESNTMGTWSIFVNDSGVSAMHIQIMPNNKAIFFDAASLGPSNLMLPAGNCRVNIPAPEGPVTDCFAHGAILDVFTGQLRPLKVTSDLWCSSGALDVNGELVSTGGWADGEASVRRVGCCDTCDFREDPIKLSDKRWYGTHVQLASGEFAVFGGRHAWNFEFIAPEGKPSPGRIPMPFLERTNDRYENNLYPFISVAPDGNLFILANSKSILFDPIKNVEVREFPELPGGARNYPGSGGATTLPIKLKPGQKDANDIEFLVCGGGTPDGFFNAEKLAIFDPALDTCGRIKFMQPDAQWEIDTMPSRRVMGDMLNLPNGQIIILNGAQRGVSGWTYAEDPNFTPIVYSPNKPLGARFKELQPTTIPRMYHSVSAVITTGEVLVAGSNSNRNYTFTAKYPTELRVEKFAPPYLDKSLDPLRPILKVGQQQAKVAYGQPIVVPFELNQPVVRPQELIFSLYKPPFTTHGYSMNQRIVELAITCLKAGPPGQWTATFEAPNGGHLAPPGFYNAFLSFRGVPGVGSWIQLLPVV